MDDRLVDQFNAHFQELMRFFSTMTPEGRETVIKGLAVLKNFEHIDPGLFIDFIHQLCEGEIFSPPATALLILSIEDGVLQNRGEASLLAQKLLSSKNPHCKGMGDKFTQAAIDKGLITTGEAKKAGFVEHAPSSRCVDAPADLDGLNCLASMGGMAALDC